MYRYSIEIDRLDAMIQGAIKKQDDTVQAANDFYVATENFQPSNQLEVIPSRKAWRFTVMR